MADGSLMRVEGGMTGTKFCIASNVMIWSSSSSVFVKICEKMLWLQYKNIGVVSDLQCQALTRNRYRHCGRGLKEKNEEGSLEV